MLLAAEDAPDKPAAPAATGPRRSPLPRIAEALAVLASPILAFLGLRLLPMAPVVLPDPSMHTTFIVDPRDIFTRFAAQFTPTQRLREAARVGFLVPARIDYLLFGAVPGFFVSRYVFALIAVVPAYILLKRLYGVAAGVMAIVVVLTCPVLIVAWGTDYPDAAAVSYLLGGVACLVMPAVRHRRAWLAAAGALFTLGIWSHGMAAVLCAAAAVAYLAVRLVRERKGLVGDAITVIVSGAIVTGLLVIGSGLLIGHFNFISPTWQSFGYLNKASQYKQWHSSNWRWAPYVSYVLVPPAVIVAFAIVFARRPLSRISTPQLSLFVIGVVQLAVCVYLQFFGHLQTLEQHYFSSTIWSATCLLLAVTLAEAARPLLDRPRARWLAPLAVLSIPLIYETHPHVRAFGWVPFGALVAIGLLVAALIGRVAITASESERNRSVASFGTVVALLGVTAAALLLTVAPIPSHPILAGTIFDPPPAYADALGGSGGSLNLDYYRVTVRLPAFVGPPAYKNEQIMMWWPIQSDPPLVEPTGIFHSGFQSLPSEIGDFTSLDATVLTTRRPAEFLLISANESQCADAFKELAPYRPRIVRRTTMHAGSLVVHYWLLDFGAFAGSRYVSG